MHFNCITDQQPCKLCASAPRNSAVHALGRAGMGAALPPWMGSHNPFHLPVGRRRRRHGDGAHAIDACARRTLPCLTFENTEGYAGSTPILPTYLLPAATAPDSPPLSKPYLLSITDLSPDDLATADKNTSKVTLSIIEWFQTYDSNLTAEQQKPPRSTDLLLHAMPAPACVAHCLVCGVPAGLLHVPCLLCLLSIPVPTSFNAY
jgi:hypothetical protein